MNEDTFAIRRAKAAYYAYGQTTDFKNYQGNPMPTWENLTALIREAWVNASNVAARYCEPPSAYSQDQIDAALEGRETDELLVEGINRLRYAAAQLESGEVASFALVFVPDNNAPIYSFRVSGCTTRDACASSAQLIASLRSILDHIQPVWSEARLVWRNETPLQGQAK